MTEVANGTPTIVESTPEENSVKKKNIEKLHELLSSGRKLLLVRDADKAVDVLSDATSLSNTIYGEFAPDCYPSHLFYGRALLEYASELNTVVKVNEANDDEESDCSEDDGGGVNKKEDQEEDVDEENGQSPDSESKEADGVPTDELEEETLNGDDPGDFLKSAFEVLDVARLICEKKLESNPMGAELKEWQLKMADVQNYLGCVYQSDEQYEKSKEELMKAAETKQKLLEEHDRELAEIFYNVGKTHFLTGEYAEAVPFFEKAVNVFDKNIELLSATEDDRKKNAAEVSELIQLRKEVVDHIDDAEDSAREKANLKSQLAETFETVPTVAPNEVINDVSNLVRKRKKNGNLENSAPADEPSVDEATDFEAKKMKRNE